ncbi:hypothetical protein ZONE111904_05805 [Zobellia nedashkovskayae]
MHEERLEKNIFSFIFKKKTRVVPRGVFKRKYDFET